MTSIRRLASAACCLVTLLQSARAADLPSIDYPLPFGSNVISLPPREYVNQTSPRTVDLLAVELQRQETTLDRRAELITDLGRTRLAAALKPLRRAAEDSDPLIRASAAAALGNLHDANAAKLIMTLSKDPDAVVRAEAVRAAGESSLRQVVDRGINDSDPEVVRIALSIAGAEEGTAIGRRLDDPDVSIRLQAVEAVGRARIRTYDVAISKLLSCDVATKSAAARTLGEIEATSRSVDIVRLLTDTHPTVRREAVGALPGVLSLKDARTYAIKMLDDPDLTVRTAAAYVLLLVPGPSAVAPLVSQLSQPYAPLHDAALAALAAAGDASGPAAGELLDNSNSKRREDGAYLLGVLGSKLRDARLIELLNDPDWSVVAQVAKSLGEISDQKSTQKLEQTVERVLRKVDGTTLPTSPDTIAATNAIVSAAEMGDASITPLVCRTIFQRTSYPSNIRAASIWALGVVGTTNEKDFFSQLNILIEDPFEAGDVKIEAVKAVGNRRSTAGESVFKSADKVMKSPEEMAIIHWSGDRLHKAVTPFSMPPEIYRAETSIVDIPAE